MTGYVTLPSSSMPAKEQTRALVDDSFADGIQNEFGSAVETQLFKDVAAVRLYGVRTDEKSGRDLVR
jgi:hypothetical protein